MNQPKRTPPTLPTDWTAHEDGLTLVFEALAVAAVDRDEETLVAVAGIGVELAQGNAIGPASLVVRTLAAYLTGEDLRTAILDSGATEHLATAQRIVSGVMELPRPSRVRAAFYSLAAQISRQRNAWDSASELFRAAATDFERLEMPIELAQALQSFGAVAFEIGDGAQAERAANTAITIFLEHGDLVGVCGTGLNLAQYALAADDADLASERLEAIRSHVRSLRSAHFSASFLRLDAMVAIARGDYATGKLKLSTALRNARRHDDIDLQAVILQNMANLTERTRGARAALPWWRKALVGARLAQDPRKTAGVARKLGALLASHGAFDEAVHHLEEAVHLSRDLNDQAEEARALADLGATHLGRALSSSGNADTGTNDHRPLGNNAHTGPDDLAIAEAYLLQALATLSTSGDYPWAARTARNLRSTWAMQHRSAFGAEFLEALVRDLDWPDGQSASSVMRTAAMTGLDAGWEPDRAVQLIRRATRLDNRRAVARALDLAGDAAYMSGRYGHDEAALTLYDIALGLLEGTDDTAAYGNLLNDSAIVAARIEQYDDAHARLTHAEDLAANTENRVLGALAKVNLGELSLRVGHLEVGRRYLTSGAELSVQVGDLGQAAEAWASIANSYLEGSADLDQAEAAASNARALADSAKSPQAMARVWSAWASLNFAQGEYRSAYENWMEAIAFGTRDASATYRAFALDALARARDWPQYNRDLEGFVRASRRTGTQLQLATQLWWSARSWALDGDARRAAKPLAYAVFLAAEGFERRPARDLRTPTKAEMDAYLGVARAFTSVQATLSLDTLDEHFRERLRHYWVLYLTRTGGEEAAEVLAQEVAAIAAQAME